MDVGPTRATRLSVPARPVNRTGRELLPGSGTANHLRPKGRTKDPPPQSANPNAAALARVCAAPVTRSGQQRAAALLRPARLRGRLPPPTIPVVRRARVARSDDLRDVLLRQLATFSVRWLILSANSRSRGKPLY